MMMMMMMKNRTSLWSICLKIGTNKVEAQLSGEDSLDLLCYYILPLFTTTTATTSKNKSTIPLKTTL